MRQITLKTALVAGFVLGLSSCSRDAAPKANSFSGEAAIELLEALSTDELAGRGTATEGSAAARELITARMSEIGLASLGDGYSHTFPYNPEGQEVVPGRVGTNLIGWLEGTSGSDLVMAVTSHHDHLGVVDGEIYNGADDNASGVAGMLAIADYFAAYPPLHDVVFVAFDAEESGHGGSSTFVESPPFEDRLIAFNLNLDMIARGDNGQLWASGTAHHPGLIPMVESVAADAPVEVKMGYDGRIEGQEDWTDQSDHWAFHKGGYIYLYLGVEDHPDYHAPSDDFAKIDQAWFLKSIETAVMMAVAADAQLEAIDAMAGE